MKTAIQHAAEIYEQNGMLLAPDLENYLKFGFVFCTPDRLLLARGINVNDGPDNWLARPDSGDAWYVKLAVGHGCIPWFLSMAPSPKPYVAWKRDFSKGTGDLHVYQFNRFKERFSHVH